MGIFGPKIEVKIQALPSEWPLRFLLSRRKFRVAEDIVVRYEVRVDGGGWQARHVVVPAGQYSNGASVPRLLQGVLPVMDDCLAAGVVHDDLAS